MHCNKRAKQGGEEHESNRNVNVTHVIRRKESNDHDDNKDDGRDDDDDDDGENDSQMIHVQGITKVNST